MKKILFYGVLIVACLFELAVSSERNIKESISSKTKSNPLLSCKTPTPENENLAESYEFVTKWGSYGSGDGQFINPRGIAVDSKYIYVVDSGNNRIQQFDLNGQFLMKWGNSGSGEGQFNNPQGIAVNDNRVYVADSGNKRVQIFYNTGAFISKIINGPEFPAGLATLDFYTYAGNYVKKLYVVDMEECRIYRYTLDGDYVDKIGGYGSNDGEFRSPWGISTSRIIGEKWDTGIFFVADDSELHINNRIQRFYSWGDFINKWGSYGSGAGKFNCPTGVASDWHYIFVTDKFNHRVQKFNIDGTFVAEWGKQGSADGEFLSPWGIAVYSSYVYVVDSGNSRIQKFRKASQNTIKVASPIGGEVWNVGSSHNITWTTTGTVANVKIEYSTNSGTSWTTVIALTPNTNTYAWTVPNAPSANCLVRISDAANAGVSDVSDAVFSIVPAILPPRIALSKTSFNFGAVAGGASTSSQPVIVSNSGTGTLNWKATSSQLWLGVTPASGTGTGTVSASVNASGLTVGTYTEIITFTSTNATNSPQTIAVNLNIYGSGATLAPFGEVSTPTDGTLGVTGAIPVTGWVVDDIEVTKVEILRDNVTGETPGQWAIGDAIFVEGARPDIEAAFPALPLNYRAGWGYMMLTNMLPGQGNGTIKLYAYATDKEGNRVLLGTKTIVCDNAHATKPFGTIDSPTQGGSASGSSYMNWGWVLTPLEKTVPKDGSTILVYVDGVLVGDLKTPPNFYNAYRSDVSGAFPGLNNTSGPVGLFYLNTTGYTNAVHTIQWVAFDDGSQGDGIGSRYFSILNTGIAAQVRSEVINLEKADSYEFVMNLPVSFEPKEIMRGFNLKADPEVIKPNNYGILNVEIKEVERIEVDLGKGNAYRGYLVVGDELRPLPIGSTLDSETGRFSWMPGPGFLGRYDLLFLQTDELGTTRKIPIKVTIRPKFEKE